MTAPPSILKLLIMDRPVEIRALTPSVLMTLAAAYDVWRVAGPGDGRPIVLELQVNEAESSDALQIAVWGSRLRITGAGVSGWADARTLTAACSLPRALMGDPSRLVSEVTDTLLLFLLTRSGRTPLHAAGVMFGETALVLAGPSGSGKSTLSLTAMGRGLRVLSDDTVYIQLQPCLKVWGFPRPVHVFPSDAPEFTGATRLRGGKLKAAVPVPPWSGLPMATRAAVVLLAREGAVQLEPVEPAVAAGALSRLEPGFDLLSQDSEAAIAAITARSAWRLTLSRDPAAAVDLLAARFGPSTPGP